jgi:hypothetical protein
MTISSPISIFSPCFKSGIPKNRMILNFTSHQQMPVYACREMGNGLGILGSVSTRLRSVCFITKCRMAVVPQLASCTCSPKLWQPKHEADQSQLTVSSSCLTSFQALVLRHADTLCSLLQPSTELTKPKLIFHIFRLLQIRTSPGFCFVRN